MFEFLTDVLQGFTPGATAVIDLVAEKHQRQSWKQTTHRHRHGENTEAIFWTDMKDICQLLLEQYLNGQKGQFRSGQAYKLHCFI